MTVEFARQVFRGNDIRGDADSELTDAFATALGAAFARRARQLGERQLLLCRDARNSSPRLHRALVAGVQAEGVEVLDLGIGPTPLLGFALATSGHTRSGIMITASHNPKNQNGFKLVLGGNPLFGKDLASLHRELKPMVACPHPTTPLEASSHYLQALRTDIGTLAGFRVVIDGANGAAGPLAARALGTLGAEVIEQFCEPDGDFPNRSPDTSKAENLEALCRRVRREKADVGIGMDGDGDRMVAVTGAGRLLDADDLIGLFARQVLADTPGASIVFDVKCSSLVARQIDELGGQPIMDRAGRSFIQTRMRSSGAAFAAEYSAHYFFADRWFGTDDGIYAACRLLAICRAQAQTLEQLCPPVSGKVATGEIYLPVPDREKFDLVEELRQQGGLEIGGESPEVITTDGLRLEYSQGWALVRASNTSAALTLRFEAVSELFLTDLKNKMCALLGVLSTNIDTDAILGNP